MVVVRPSTLTLTRADSAVAANPAAPPSAPIGARDPRKTHPPFLEGLPVVLWAAVIFALSSIPSLNSGLGTWDTVLRKCAHATEYAILGVLLLRALGRELPAVVIGIAYAASDEVHQHFVAGP